ncbi:LPXTG cell wall anchor domain-containing protein, partial [Streptococcus mitis]|nr:LPXTG cell wall anchor domain-containing protein [Streptococcus mitis]
VEVGKDGTVTVTFPDGSTTTVTPDKTVKSADSNGAKDPSVTPVKDPANLTDAEKAKVADEVKKSNPTAKDVEVGKDGTVTVTFPDGSTTTVTPDKTVKSADSNGAKDPSVTPVKDPANLTDAEKAKVADEVKKSNPTAKDVEVGKDGTVTVTFPDGSTTTVTPDKTVKSADSNGAKDPSVTPVKDPANLTDAEKAKVVDEVKKSNPTAKDVEVGKDGTVTVTFPDGSTAVIPAAKAVAKAKDSEGVQNPSKPATDAGKNTPVAQDQTAKPANKSKDSEGVKAPSATSVKDPSNLTDAEKAKVADEVKKSNPTATDVKVGKDGTTTVSFPDGSTAVIPADKAVAKANDSEGVQDPSATAVKDPSNLTDADKAKAASNASQATSAQANARKGAKELPNTGTADSTVAMVAAAASALLGLGLAGRRRKEDEEA